jgi:hypothetical protein
MRSKKFEKRLLWAFEREGRALAVLSGDGLDAWIIQYSVELSNRKILWGLTWKGAGGSDRVRA